MTYQVLHGNNLDILPTLEDNSIDSIVTDPPYELGFMGKKWDSSGIAYSVELWQQCLRVLKPGGHLLSFGGTRTWHRVAVAIEDAGFEVRDSIAWLYGSGFPKSLDVSKAIDKNNGKITRLSDFTIWMRTTGLTVRQVTDALREANLISENGTMASHYFATSESSQPAIPTAAMWQVIRPMIAEVPNWVDEMVARIEAEREVIGQKTSGIANKAEGPRHTIGASKAIEVDITAPATPEAQQWQGWGTALKPAFEPIVVARKPIEGTVANNVLKWGTGGLNIDGSRIGSRDKDESGWAKTGSKASDNVALGRQYDREPISEVGLGRWPANIILDPYTAGLLDEQSGQSKSNLRPATGKPHLGKATSVAQSGGTILDLTDRGHNDSGGASRFFYVAKASKRDRNEGLDELQDSVSGSYSGNVANDGNKIGAQPNKPNQPAKNFHPTVKPTTLMEYLIKLVTPPGGVVLDPFTGSGSTGKAAILQGFDFIGIEMTEEYLPIIEGRLKHAEQLVAEAKEQEKLKENEVLF